MRLEQDSVLAVMEKPLVDCFDNATTTKIGNNIKTQLR